MLGNFAIVCNSTVLMGSEGGGGRGREGALL